MKYNMNFIGICKQTNKYDCQPWNTKRIVDIKENIWLTNVNLILQLHGCIYCTISCDVGINKEKEICLQKKVSMSVHRLERRNVDYQM